MKNCPMRRYELAFYVKSLRFRDTGIDSTALEKLFNQAEADVTLSDAATLNDRELQARLSESGEKATAKVAAVRLHSPEGHSLNSLQLAREYIAGSLDAYRKSAFGVARQKALAAYLEGIEPVEAQLRANDPQFTVAIEAQMLRLRKAVEDRKPVGQVKKEAEKSLEMVSQAGKLIQDTKLTFWLSLLLTASILLREGVEAFLIIAVVLAIIRTSGTKKALPWLHGGWLAAILVGLLGWFFSGWILEISGRGREMMEGAVSLLAVVVLVFVGFWLHSNSHARQWKAFIEDKVHRLLNKERMIGLAVFSFMVVFREAFESVLFLRAISLETSPENQSAIGFGVAAAFIVIALLVILFLRFSQRIPVRQLFRYSSWVVTLLAVILIGKGIHSIQESGIFSVTGLPLDFRVDWLGLYPTMETVLSQALLLAVILSLGYLNSRKFKLNG
ncbi:FTR1 family iron permease [Pontibacter rugosus]